MPDISLIVAIDRNRGMGCNNQLPWHLPADLAYFKKQTLGKPIIMGRKTFESIGRALPDRLNIVLSQSGFTHEGVVAVSTIDEALAKAQDAPEVMVIGGASIYEAFLPYADNLYITEIDGEFEADVFFPELDGEQWVRNLIDTHVRDARNAYDVNFYKLTRTNGVRLD